VLPAARTTPSQRPSAPARAGGPNAPATAPSAESSTASAVLGQPEADVAETIADEIARRAELLMVAQRGKADAREFEIDRMRTEFDLHEQERAELLREWNSTRDLAMEQMKKDDEIVKKWIALI
jgi:hypothetical protein